MRQVFLLISGQPSFDLEQSDALPLSEHLLVELATLPAAKNIFLAQSTMRLSAFETKSFLSSFYSRYELSYPQRRVYQRFERLLSVLSPDQQVEWRIADVSERRSRRFQKKV